MQGEWRKRRTEGRRGRMSSPRRETEGGRERREVRVCIQIGNSFAIFVAQSYFKRLTRGEGAR